jgi:hypothetical protein
MRQVTCVTFTFLLELIELLVERLRLFARSDDGLRLVKIFRSIAETAPIIRKGWTDGLSVERGRRRGR